MTTDTPSLPPLFVTGLSGAGISTTLKILEDCGYEVFDNFPLTHIESIINDTHYTTKPLAFGIDTRTRAFCPDRVIQLAKETNANIVFLRATNAVLHKRFSETRRKHPMAKDRTVTDGIIYEREWLDPLLNYADVIIDTTDMSVHDLKDKIEAKYIIGEHHQKLSVTVMSFGFKHGVPREVDMILDVRFLKNPHWDPKLKPMTGQDKPVQDYINTDPNTDVFFDKTLDMVDFLLPNYITEGKSYFTIGFGCTGGKHRSVYMAEKLSQHLKDAGHIITIRHRDMNG